MATISDITAIISQMQSLADAGELTEESFTNLMNQTDSNTTGFKKLGDVVVAGTAGISNFTKQIASGNEKMTAMNGAIDIAAKAIGGLMGPLGGFAEGLGAAVTFAMERIQVSFDAFQDLAAAGQIGAEGLTQLREDMYKAGIPLETYATMLKNNANDLADIYGSSLKGSEEFASAMGAMRESGNNELRYLGFTIQDIGKTLVDFQKTSRRMGVQQSFSTDELIAKATKYGKELDLLSKLTSANKETIQKERDERMLETAYRSYMEGVTKKYGADKAAEIEFLVSTAGKYGKAHQDQAKASVMGQINFIDGQKAAFSEVMPVYQKAVQDIIKGEKNHLEISGKATREAAIKSGEHALKMGETLKFLGENNEMFAGSGVAIDNMKIALNTSEDELFNARAAQILQTKETDRATKSAVDYQKSMQVAITTLDMTITKLIPTEFIIEKFTTGLDLATDAIRTLLDIPSSVSNYKEAGGDEQHIEAIDNRDRALAQLSNAEEKLKRAYVTKNELVINEWKSEVQKLKEELRDAEDDINYFKSDVGIQAKQERNLEKLVKEKEEVDAEAKESPYGVLDFAKESTPFIWDRKDLDLENAENKSELNAESVKLGKEIEEVNKQLRLSRQKNSSMLNREGDAEDVAVDMTAINDAMVQSVKDNWEPGSGMTTLNSKTQDEEAQKHLDVMQKENKKGYDALVERTKLELKALEATKQQKLIEEKYAREELADLDRAKLIEAKKTEFKTDKRFENETKKVREYAAQQVVDRKIAGLRKTANLTDDAKFAKFNKQKNEPVTNSVSTENSSSFEAAKKAFAEKAAADNEPPVEVTVEVPEVPPAKEPVDGKNLQESLEAAGKLTTDLIAESASQITESKKSTADKNAIDLENAKNSLKNTLKNMDIEAAILKEKEKLMLQPKYKKFGGGKEAEKDARLAIANLRNTLAEVAGLAVDEYRAVADNNNSEDKVSKDNLTEQNKIALAELKTAAQKFLVTKPEEREIINETDDVEEKTRQAEQIKQSGQQLESAVKLNNSVASLATLLENLNSSLEKVVNNTAESNRVARDSMAAIERNVYVNNNTVS